MDFFTALDVSGTGMSAERVRVNVASSNLANADTTRGPNGQPYRRMDPVFEAVPMMAPDGQIGGASEPPGVRVSQIISDPNPGKRIYSPGHPDADAQGFVTLPNVNPVHEVVNLLSASRSYEANATAVETLKGMAQRGLDIAR